LQGWKGGSTAKKSSGRGWADWLGERKEKRDIKRKRVLEKKEKSLGQNKDLKEKELESQKKIGKKSTSLTTLKTGSGCIV